MIRKHSAKLTPGVADFPVTFFYSYAADHKDMAAHTFDSLAALLKKPPSATDKEALPWIKLAHFGEARSRKGSLRHDANVEMLSGIEADYDLEAIQPHEAALKLRQAGIQAIVYTSPSHSPEKPRWRVLCPFSHVYEDSLDGLRAIRTAMLGRVQGVLGADCPLSNESWVLSQSYYYGYVEGRATYECIVVEGQPVDTLDGLPELGNLSQRRPKAAKNGFDFGVDIGADVRNLAMMGEDVHGSQLRISASMAGKGVPVEAIIATMQAGMLPGKPDENAPAAERERWQQRWNEIPRVAQSAVEKFTKVQVEVNKPEPRDVESAAGVVRLVTPAEIMSRPQVQWAVKGILPAGDIGNVIGDWSTGKSFLMTDLGCAIARGVKSWHGHRIKRRGLFVHVSLEGQGMRNRLDAYCKHYGVEPDALALYQVFEVPVNMRDAADVQKLVDSIALAEHEWEQGPVAVVMDTMNRALAGGDENSSQDVGAYMTALEQVRALFPNATIINVHHEGKDGSGRSRGHSSITSNPGFEWRVTAAPEGSDVRGIEIKKMRDGQTGERLGFTLKVVGLGTDEDGDEVTSCVVHSEAAPPPVEKKMRKLGGNESFLMLVFKETQEWWNELRREERHALDRGEVRKSKLPGALPWQLVYDAALKRKPDFKQNINRTLTSLLAKKMVRTWDADGTLLIARGVG